MKLGAMPIFTNRTAYSWVYSYTGGYG